MAMRNYNNQSNQEVNKIRMNHSKELLDFIDKSPTAFHVIENMKQELLAHGFIEFSEKEKWEMKAGTRGFVIRNHSSMIAFEIPSHKITGFHIAAAHSDSPSFKIKENAEKMMEHHYVKLNVEKYGGMIPESWFDRPLSVAGRVVIAKNGALEEKLVNLNRDLMIIPSLAIHMTRNSKETPLSIQKELQPLYAMEEGEGTFLTQLASEVGATEKDLLGMDLFLYNRQKGTLLGSEQEFIGSPRLDDQECVFGGLKGFLANSNMETTSGNGNILAVFDNEEVGSLTRQGADSNFLSHTLANICEGFGLTEGDYRRLLANSFLISADNAHAVHPNYTEKADPTNRPYLNHGIVIKYHGGQKYTTDALTGAYVKKLCQDSGISYQTYQNHSDIAGGSTLGNIALGKVSIPAADIGLAQLAMHSAFETAGSKDLSDLITFMTAFFR